MAELISYIASGITLILGMIEPFNKKMKVILIYNFIGNFLVSLSYLLVSSYSGAGICAIACIQLIINYIYEARGEKVPYWVIALYALSFVGVNALSFAHWYDAFSLVAALCFVFGMAQKNPSIYRILYVCNSTLWIVYDVFAGAYGNLVTHVTLFAATLIAILIRDVRDKKQVNK